MTREQQIEQYMKSLQISREEAEQLYEDDQEDFIGEEGEQMTAKAKEVRRYEQSAEKKVRKPREKKIDQEKVTIVDFVWACMLNNSHLIDFKFENVNVIKPQKEITFQVGENKYSLTLTKHRPPKK